jgi:LPXTG-motif cell wall-anchored protein
MNINIKFQNPHSISTRLIRGGLLILLSSLITLGGVSPAAASTYTVPESGLSFDANDTVEANVCTTGYGNVLLDEFGDPAVDPFGDPFTEDDEINFLIATESVTYLNVAEINGDDIDARVTLTSVTGMYQQEFRNNVPVLDRLDKCDEDSGTGLMELSFDSETATPGDANFVLTIEFFHDENLVTLNNLKMNVEDIDNNQYLEVDGFTSVRLAENRTSEDVQEYANGEDIAVDGTNVTYTTDSSTARRYHASGSSSGTDSTLEKDKHVVEVTYAATDSIQLKLGAYEDGGGSFDLNFQGFTFQEPENLLASTGVSESFSLGIIAAASGTLIGLGALLVSRKRRYS